TTRPGGRIAPPGAGPAVRGVSEGGKLVPAPRPVRSPPASVTARPSLSTTHGAPDARAPGSPDRTDRRGTARPGRPLAGRQRPAGGPDLPAREPAAHRAPAAGAHQAAPARPLGHLTGTEPGVHAPRPRDRTAREGHAGHLGARSRRPLRAGQLLAGGQLQRDVPRRRPRRGGHGAALPAVLLPRRRPQPRRPRGPRLGPRGRRTRLLPRARLRGRL